MSTESIVSLVLGFFLGLFSGIYSGFFLARLQKFTDLRHQAKRMLLEIDFLFDKGKAKFTKRQDGGDLSLISSELHAYGHHRAGEILFALSGEINCKMSLAAQGSIGSEDFDNNYASWQKLVSELSPSKARLFSLRFNF